jgi:hypothetical protein
MRTPYAHIHRAYTIHTNQAYRMEHEFEKECINQMARYYTPISSYPMAYILQKNLMMPLTQQLG